MPSYDVLGSFLDLNVFVEPSPNTHTHIYMHYLKGLGMFRVSYMVKLSFESLLTTISRGAKVCRHSLDADASFRLLPHVLETGGEEIGGHEFPEEESIGSEQVAMILEHMFLGVPPVTSNGLSVFLLV